MNYKFLSDKYILNEVSKWLKKMRKQGYKIGTNATQGAGSWFYFKIDAYDKKLKNK